MLYEQFLADYYNIKERCKGPELKKYIKELPNEAELYIKFSKANDENKKRIYLKVKKCKIRRKISKS